MKFTYVPMRQSLVFAGYHDTPSCYLSVQKGLLIWSLTWGAFLIRAAHRSNNAKLCSLQWWITATVDPDVRMSREVMHVALWHPTIALVVVNKANDKSVELKSD
jgi:hypothetical protein